MRTISSWSGGKDSCLACYKAISQGHRIEYLMNFISEEYRRCCFHGIAGDLMRLQSTAIGIPLIQREVPADMQEYEERFKSAVNKIRRDERDIQGMVFGDIYLDEHKGWVDRVCSELNMAPIEPLWNTPAEEVAREFVDSGFRAIVVSARADLFAKDILGRVIDHSFIDDLRKRNICPCGENGEFHTFVYDGPLFRSRINISETEEVLKEGFWKHWFLDIKKYGMTAKYE